MVISAEVYKMVDHHVREGRGRDPLLFMLTNMHTERGKMCVYCGERHALMRGQRKCPSLPINCTLQGLAKLFIHFLHTCSPASCHQGEL